MATYLVQAVDGIRAVVNAACPEVTAIWESKDVSQVAYDNLTFPMSVIKIGAMPTDEWGTANIVYMLMVEIYYVAEWNGLNDSILGKLETLRDAFEHAVLPVGQVIDVIEMDDSRDLEINQFFAAKRDEHTAGKLTVQILVGETYL